MREYQRLSPSSQVGDYVSYDMLNPYNAGFFEVKGRVTSVTDRVGLFGQPMRDFKVTNIVEQFEISLEVRR